MRGGAFFNGKEGRDDFRTKAQAPLADQNSGRAIAPPATSLALMLRVSVPYKGNRRGRKDY